MDGGVAIGHCTLSCLVIGGVYFALFVVSMLMLFALRNSYEIQNRNVTLLVFHNVTGLICAMAWMFGIGFRLWSCELSEILLQTSDFLFVHSINSRACSLTLLLWDGNRRVLGNQLDRPVMSPDGVTPAPRGARIRVILALLRWKRYLTDANLIRAIVVGTVAFAVLMVWPISRITVDRDRCNMGTWATVPNYLNCVGFLSLLTLFAWLLHDVEDTHMIKLDLVVSITMSSPCILLVYIWEFGAPPPSIYAMFPTCNFLLIFMIISLFSTVTFPVGKTALASWHARVDPEEAKGTIEALARGKDDDMLERLKRFAVGEFCVELPLFLAAHNTVTHAAVTALLPNRANGPRQIVRTRKYSERNASLERGGSYPSGYKASSSNVGSRSAGGGGSVPGASAPPQSLALRAPARRLRWPTVWHAYENELWDPAGGMPNLPEELVHSYKSVVEDFIQERAPNEINIGARLRREVLERIATGTFSIDVLDRVRDEVLSLLADNVWLKFVEAEEKTAAGREQKGDGGGAGA